MLFIWLSVLFASASGACFDNGDKEIGGSCYKLVNQRLSFEDARYWCHYQNPVTASFLSYVPNAMTGNFLASYARSAFGTDNGNFWIGLSRNSSSSPWQWDNGAYVGYTNMGSDLGENYMAESIVNTKWNSHGDNELLPFVCSYDPAAPPTFGPPMSTAVPPTTARPSSNCLPSDPATFFFAYSNDLDNDTILEAADWINSSPDFPPRPFANFASVRFDVQVPEDVRFFENLNDLVASVNSTLTNPLLSFKNVSAPTDAIDIVRGFVEKYPVCGTTILLLVKRNSDPQDISDTVRLLQTHHFIVYIAASDVLISGSTSTPLYELSTRTNGICSFGEISYNFFLLAHSSMYYTFYAVNVEVQGQGTKSLPSFDERVFELCATGQGHSLTNDYFSFFINTDLVTLNGTNPNLDPSSRLSGTLLTDGWHYPKGVTNVSITYNYPTTHETLQIRFISYQSVNYWLPYDNNF